MQSRFESYGIDQAYLDALQYLDQPSSEGSEEAIQRINEELNPLSVEPYLTGVLFVYSKSDQYRSGVYVDEMSLDDWGGSGFEINPWNDRAGWVKIKTRTPVDFENRSP